MPGPLEGRLLEGRAGRLAGLPFLDLPGSGFVLLAQRREWFRGGPCLWLDPFEPLQRGLHRPMTGMDLLPLLRPIFRNP